MPRPVSKVLFIAGTGADGLVVVLDKYHWMLFLLTPAMYPRFLITLDEKLEAKPVTVRVGQVSRRICLSTRTNCISRLSTLLGRPESHGQYPASKPISLLFGLGQLNEQNWQQKNSFLSAMC